MRAPEAHGNKAIPIDGRTAEAITEQRRVSGRSSNGNPDQPIRSSLILNPEFLSAEVLEETWRTLVQAAERGLGGLLVIAFR
jgi:hypothetical protein